MRLWWSKAEVCGHCKRFNDRGGGREIPGDEWWRKTDNVEDRLEIDLGIERKIVCDGGEGLLRRVRKQRDEQLSHSPSREGNDSMYLSGNDAEVGGVVECFDFSKKLVGMGLMKKGLCPLVRDSEVTHRMGGHHHENVVSMSVVNDVKVQAIVARNTTRSHPSFDHDGIVMGCPPLSIALKAKSPQKSVPLWVKFFDAPLQLWSLMGLSYMASTVGRPIVLNKITDEMCHDWLGRIGFANILIKVDATRKLPELIRMKMPMNENCEPKTLEAHVGHL
ncbi:hypothetical protein Pint_12903 [Pistacia integerrima]|uniref:Uncharacterized protein n=1 Tax=Pistacia integerrima TaxID=434235 RepID=A0ACC0YA83_9ROSI|nr:hypothetical protein Pint_12903 [Pistacia integerrima]